jgi:hypothetical protein
MIDVGDNTEVAVSLNRDRRDALLEGCCNRLRLLLLRSVVPDMM